MKRFARKFAVDSAARLGYTVIPTWRLENLALATHLRTLFELCGIDVVIDVGANKGQFKSLLREHVGFRGVIHSFEPQPALAQGLERMAAAEDGWFVHAVGLGSRSGDLKLNVMAHDVFSSFREPHQGLVREFADGNRVVETALVPVHRLDDLAPDLAGVAGGKVYLKCDTQGFDLEVMRGAPDLMSKLKALQFEVSFRRIYEGAPSYLEALRTVEGFGFAVSGFFPVVADRELRAIEMDCVMVRAAQG